MTFIRLNKDSIEKHLAYPEDIQLHLFDEISSTQTFLKNLTFSDHVDVCIAECQTKGRGRFGRPWDSPSGKNIYLSLRIPHMQPISQLSGATLVTGLAILDSLENYPWHDQVYIKWPNDLLWQEKKLCGILIELVTDTCGQTAVVIGIGLNTNHETMMDDRCSLHNIAGHGFDRNELAAKMLNAVLRDWQLFLSHGMSYFMHRWFMADGLYGKTIELNTAEHQFTGKACGINYEGCLGLEDSLGSIRYFSSGEASLGTGFVPGLSNEPGTG